MDHSALASLRQRAWKIADRRLAQTGFQIATDPSLNTAASVALGAAIVGVGGFFYMQKCRASLASKFARESMDYDARVDGDVNSGPNNFLAGVAAGLERASNVMQGADT